MLALELYVEFIQIFVKHVLKSTKYVKMRGELKLM